MTETPDALAALRAPLMILGLILIVTGSLLLLYVASMVFTVLNDPAEIKIVEYVIKAIKTSDLAVQGAFKDSQDSTRDIKFELFWSEPVRTILFLFMGIAVASLLARTLGVLINTGISLMRLATGEREPKKRKIDHVV